MYYSKIHFQTLFFVCVNLFVRVNYRLFEKKLILKKKTVLNKALHIYIIFHVANNVKHSKVPITLSSEISGTIWFSNHCDNFLYGVC